MKICPSCGWSNADVKANCSRCGTTLPNAVNVTPPTNVNPSSPPHFSANSTSHMVHTPVIIQARSQNCTVQIEQRNAMVGKAVSSILWIAVGLGMLIYGINYLKAIIEGISLRWVESPSLGRTLIALGVMVAGFIANKKLFQYCQDELDVYRRYCATESLIVDSEKVYGSTSRESIKLYYNMIEGVRYRPSASNTTSQVSYGDILEILCVNRKVYTFYSFTNCNELKTIIEMNLHSQR